MGIQTDYKTSHIIPEHFEQFKACKMIDLFINTFSGIGNLSRCLDLQPILLFNEADVLLKKLENFKAVFLANTNMIRSFDHAFERRFLFKIEFQPPALPAKEKIWQSNIDHLTKDESNQMARKFAFTGGQIDNISKKPGIFEVLHDKTASIQQIEAFCNEEFFDYANGQKLGFTK
ncbi:MAG: hypothetical protein ACQESX_06110 [Bacteroidota bacterium]